MAQDTVEGLDGVKTVDNQLTVRSESPAEYSDSWLSMKIHSALMFHRNVDADAVGVTAENGKVSLHGEATSLAQKELTGEYAKDVDGARVVNNEMTVATDPPKAAEPFGGQIDDASITAQIKWTLLAHHSTSAIKTHVQTKDGVVTVSGPASNDAEKSLVTKLVNDINGVTRVVNNMETTAPAASL
jgi:osmotically-inducible protein OsmY